MEQCYWNVPDKPVSITMFPSQLSDKFDGNLVSLYLYCWLLYRYIILHMPWHHNCSVISNFCNDPNIENLEESNIKLPSNLNYACKIVNQMGPCTVYFVPYVDNMRSVVWSSTTQLQPGIYHWSTYSIHRSPCISKQYLKENPRTKVTYCCLVTPYLRLFVSTLAQVMVWCLTTPSHCLS